MPVSSIGEASDRPACEVRELPWLRGARLKRGPLVQVIGLSEDHALIESALRMGPGFKAVLQLLTTRKEFDVPFKARWCEVAHIGRAGIIYRTECTFERHVDWSDVGVPSSTVSRATADESAG